MAGTGVSSVVQAVLEPLLGEHTTARALEQVQARTGKPADELIAEDLPGIEEALRPLLVTLLGAGSARSVLEDLRQRIGGSP